MQPTATAFYAVLVGCAVALAFAERIVSLRNERRLASAGAAEVAPWVFRAMVPVYAAIFPAAILEHVLAHRSLPGWLAGAAVALFGAAKLLKLSVIRHLKEAWTMKVFAPKELRVITTGPYRSLRHPNYVAVMAEVLTLPIAGGAVLTAAIGGCLFAGLLYFRVRTEEAALLARPEYAARMGGKSRFFPGGSRSGTGSGAGRFLVLTAVLLHLLAPVGHAVRAGEAPLQGVPEETRSPGPGGTRILRFDPSQCAITFRVHRPGEIVEGRARELSGEITFDPYGRDATASVRIAVRSASLETGNRIRDRKMRNSHLEVGRFPEIRFHSVQVGFPDAPHAESERKAIVEGVLDLHGTQRQLRLPVWVRWEGETLRAGGEFSIKLSDYGIPIPRFLWMVLDDAAEVEFRLVAVPVATAAR